MCDVLAWQHNKRATQSAWRARCAPSPTCILRDERTQRRDSFNYFHDAFWSNPSRSGSFSHSRDKWAQISQKSSTLSPADLLQLVQRAELLCAVMCCNLFLISRCQKPPKESKELGSGLLINSIIKWQRTLYRHLQRRWCNVVMIDINSSLLLNASCVRACKGTKTSP